MQRIVLSLFLCLFVADAFGQSIYRYKNEQGNTVLDTKIPPEYVANGYEVIDFTGNVLERVAPTVVDSNAEQLVLTAEDELLLSNYSEVEEIREHEERKVFKLESDLAIIQSDRVMQQQQLENVQKKRQRYIDNNRDLPEEVDLRIQELMDTIASLDKQEARRKKQIERTKQEFDRKARRFEELLAAKESEDLN